MKILEGDVFISHAQPIDEAATLKLLAAESKRLDMYYGERQQIIDAAFEDGSYDAAHPSTPWFHLDGGQLYLGTDADPEFAAITHDGETLTGPRIEIGLLPLKNASLARLHHELCWAAGQLANTKLIDQYPVIVGITFPRMARAACSYLGMEHALATYIPNTDVGDDLIEESRNFHDGFITRHDLPPVVRPAIESVIIPTKTFVDAWKDRD